MKEFLKTAQKTSATGDPGVRERVAEMLAVIEQGGESAALKYALELDNYTRDTPIVSPEDIKSAGDRLSPQVKTDIQFAFERVRSFAGMQRESLIDFEKELSPGLWAGQKQIPVNTAGCYIPGGRYSHVASAIMSVATAKVAGVRHIVAASPPHPETGRVPDAILYTLHLCGADVVLAMGGVQAIASMAFGLFSSHPPADILVGPGNAYVAEAKRALYGRCGIDMFAGPTEIAIIADAKADVETVAVDLVSQGEHGPTSPMWLITTSRSLGTKVLNRVPQLIDALPEPARSVASTAWRDYAEIVYCDTPEEVVEQSDHYAAEHLQVHCTNLDYYLTHLTNYGSLFLGPETCVSYGDKASGPNHVLPTKGAARYSGGLSVGKFIKTVTYQRMTREANKGVGVATARISRLEGMEAHARSADHRLAMYFPDETFVLQPDI